ncbi:helix-turn-helix domain-containing protein [Streptomyces sp. NPDC054802]
MSTGFLLRYCVTRARVREGEAVRLELATASVPVRLAAALDRLVHAASVTDMPYAVRLTQEELSQLIGASRNAVGCAIKPWRERGWVDTESGGGLLIQDMDAVRAHARAAEQR